MESDYNVPGIGPRWRFRGQRSMRPIEAPVDIRNEGGQSDKATQKIGPDLLVSNGLRDSIDP